MASPHHKAERFVTQIYWTYKNGGYETMERLILNLQDKEWRSQSYPLTEAVHQEIVSLPIGSTIRKEDVKTIVDTLNNFLL